MQMPKSFIQLYFLVRNINTNAYTWPSKLPQTFSKTSCQNLTQDLEYANTYLDDLLILTNTSFAGHLTKLEIVLARLSTAGMRINASKSKIFAEQIEYLVYWF
jgi:Reverse transcriptase (RNA-dependent DNA polymerase)